MNRKETNTAIIAIGMAAAMILGPWRAQAAVPAHAGGDSVETAEKTQRITLTLNDRPLPDALKQIEQAGGKTIIFSYGELEKYRVTARIVQKTEAEAISTVIGGKPLAMQERERYFVICRSDKAGHTTEINGRVTDGDGQPLPYCTVLLLRGDSTFIDGCATDGDGMFSMVADSEPEIVKASFVGYRSESVRYAPGRDVAIILQPDAIALDGVTITNERPLVSSTDRGVMASVIGTPLAKMGSVSDMILHLPLVMSDGSVAGRGKPEIYINNKKVRDAAELDRLRADEILTAEVITLPGVEYGAEVTSVIRLKTVRRTGEGLSGSLNETYSRGERDGGGQNVALNYRTRGGLDLFVRGHATEIRNFVEAESNDCLMSSHRWDFRRDSRWEGECNNFSADLGFNWQPGENHSVGMTYTAAGLIGDMENRNRTEEVIRRDGQFMELLDNSSVTRTRPHLSHALNAYYVGTVGKWDIDFSADLYKSSALSEMEAETNSQPAAASTTNTRNTLVAEKLTVAAPLRGGRLTVGEETSYVDRTSLFTQDGFSADNDTRQRTTIWSLFASWAIQAGPWSLTAGLRWQNELNGYDLDGKRDDATSRDYSMLLPRLSVTYAKGESRHTLAYTASRNNPQYSLLSPTVDYRSKYEYFTGNPLLLSQTTHEISYTLSWRWLYVQPYYAYTSNPIRTFQRAYDDETHPGVIITEYRNSPRQQNYGVTVNMSPRVSFWQLNDTVNLGFIDEDVEALGITNNWNDLCANVYLDNSLTMPHGWMLNATASFSTYARHNTAKIKGTGQVGLRLNKSFLKNGELNVAITASDIFKTARTRMTAYGGIGVSTQFDQYNDTRRMGIDISYKFNTTGSRYKGSHAGQSERERL